MATTPSNTTESALKSMPCPGMTSTPVSMLAMRSWPLARIPSMACSLVIPAGRSFPTMPEKMMSVALPRTLGPVAARATAVTAANTTAITRNRSGLRRPMSRRIDGPKFMAFWPTMPPPKPCPGLWPSTVARSVFFIVGGGVLMTPPLHAAKQRSRGRSRMFRATRRGCQSQRCRRPRGPGSGRHP